MHSKEQISKELALQVNSAYEEFFQGLELIESAFLDSSFGTYVKMVRLINEMKDVKEVELEKVTLEKLLKGKAFSKKKEELFWGYYEYATGYLFPNQKVLDVMTSMIESGMALFFFPFDDCSEELIINCSKEHYKIPEKSDLEEVLKKATREYLQSKVKMLNCDFSNESEKVKNKIKIGYKNFKQNLVTK